MELHEYPHTFAPRMQNARATILESRMPGRWAGRQIDIQTDRHTDTHRQTEITTQKTHRQISRRMFSLRKWTGRCREMDGKVKNELRPSPQDRPIGHAIHTFVRERTVRTEHTARDDSPASNSFHIKSLDTPFHLLSTFVCLGHLQHRLASFRTVKHSLFSLMRSLLGDFDFVALSEANQVSALWSRNRYGMWRTLSVPCTVTADVCVGEQERESLCGLRLSCAIFSHLVFPSFRLPPGYIYLPTLAPSPALLDELDLHLFA